MMDTVIRVRKQAAVQFMQLVAAGSKLAAP